jgi:hypothetical protein
MKSKHQDNRADEAPANAPPHRAISIWKQINLRKKVDTHKKVFLIGKKLHN